MQLTKNFSLKEMQKTSTGLYNTAPVEAQRNLLALCRKVLQPLRDAWGAPIVVNSGYRSEAVNKAVGGAKNSQHMLGQAADIQASLPPPPSPHNGKGGVYMSQCILSSPQPAYSPPFPAPSSQGKPKPENENTPQNNSRPSPHPGGDGREANRQLFQLIVDLGLPFDQLIDEKGYSWIHVSYRSDGRNRKQILHL